MQSGEQLANMRRALPLQGALCNGIVPVPRAEFGVEPGVLPAVTQPCCRVSVSV